MATYFCALLLAIGTANASTTQHFSIQKMPVEEALNQFADQSGITIQYNPQTLVGVTHCSLYGEYTPRDGLAELLKGTGVEAVEYSIGLFILKPSNRHSELLQQPTVTVIGRQDASKSQVSLGALGTITKQNAPFSVSSYSTDLAQRQQAETIADIFKNDPSIRLAHVAGGMLDTYVVRGFPINEGNSGEISFDGVFGVAPNYRVLSDFVERVEVLKGPVSMLTGMAPNSGIGGSINVVPKRPLDEALTDITLRYLSDTQVGGHLDLSRRFGHNDSFGIRFNGRYLQGDTARQHQSREAGAAALSLDYKGEQLRANFDLLSQHDHLDAPLRNMWLESGVNVPEAPKGTSSIANEWEWSEVDDRSVLVKLEYDLTDNLTLLANAGLGDTLVDRLFGYPFLQNNNGDINSRAMSRGRFEIERETYNLGLRTALTTGPVAHQLQLQFDAYEDSVARKTVNLSGTFNSNLYNPIFTPKPDIPDIGYVPVTSKNKLRGVSLIDTASFMNEQLFLLLGVRHQQILSTNFDRNSGLMTSRYDEDATVPIIGLTYKVTPELALYFSRSEGLSKGEIVPDNADNAGESLAPYVSEQYEVGLKYAHDNLTTSLSLFELTKPSALLVNNVYQLGGEQRNRGLELSINGELSDRFRVIGGVMLMDAKLKKTSSPVEQGNTPTGVPDIQFNLSGEYDLSATPGLTLTGSLIHTGSQYVDRNNTQKIPKWTRVDAGLRYITRLNDQDLTLRLDAQNLFNNNYWMGVDSWGGLAQGAPRTLLLSTTLSF